MIDNMSKRRRVDDTEIQKDTWISSVVYKLDHLCNLVIQQHELTNNTISNLEDRIRRYQYTIERLEKQINDLQIHALHGNLFCET